MTIRNRPVLYAATDVSEVFGEIQHKHSDHFEVHDLQSFHILSSLLLTLKLVVFCRTGGCCPANYGCVRATNWCALLNLLCII